ncbi:MAG: hypothetical protein QOD92_555 [Acidimicrobiaceae bacterium]|jgi:hypothetical protein
MSRNRQRLGGRRLYSGDSPLVRESAMHSLADQLGCAVVTRYESNDGVVRRRQARGMQVTLVESNRCRRVVVAERDGWSIGRTDDVALT